MRALMARRKQSYWWDKIKLFFAAVATAIAFLLFQFFLDRGVSLSPGWQYFVMGVVVYIGGVGLLVYGRHLWRKCTSNGKTLTLSVSWLALPIYGAFFLFYVGFLNLPETLAPYWMSCAILVPIVVIVLSRAFDRGPSHKASIPFHRRK
jgi:hypothetical protein